MTPPNTDADMDAIFGEVTPLTDTPAPEPSSVDLVPETPSAPVEIAEDDLTVEKVDAQLRAAIKDLLRATRDADVASAASRVQRLRLVRRLLKESIDGELSEDAYRELVLLTRMVKRIGPAVAEAPTSDVSSVAEDAERDLERLGMDVGAANRLASLFERISTPDLGAPPIPEDYEPPDA